MDEKSQFLLFSIASEASLQNSDVGDGNFVAAAAVLDDCDEDYAFGDFGLNGGGKAEVKGDLTVMEYDNTYYGGKYSRNSNLVSSKTGIREEQEKENSKLDSDVNGKEAITQQ